MCDLHLCARREEISEANSNNHNPMVSSAPPTVMTQERSLYPVCLVVSLNQINGPYSLSVPLSACLCFVCWRCCVLSCHDGQTRSATDSADAAEECSKSWFLTTNRALWGVQHLVAAPAHSQQVGGSPWRIYVLVLWGLVTECLYGNIRSWGWVVCEGFRWWWWWGGVSVAWF